MLSPKVQWLRSDLEFQKTFREGSRIRGHFLNLLVANTDADSPTRWGIAVGKKFGKAVDRNRIKRIAREAIRKYFLRFPNGYDLILEILPQARDFNRQATWTEIEALLKKCSGKLACH